MPVERGLFVPQTGTSPNFQGTNPTQARLALAGLLAENSPGVPRQGLLRPSTALVVTGATDMSYNIASMNPVTTRAAAAGAYVFSTTGTTNRKTTPAPGANSRYDIIWVKQNDTQFGDADNTAEIYVTQGNPAATPTKPVPTLNNAPVQGALVLAEVLVPSGATATNSAAVQITQVWRYTVPRGTPIPVRSLTERSEIAPAVGTAVIRLDTGGTVEQWAGGQWSPVSESVRLLPPDSGWSVVGGLVRGGAPSGLTMVSCATVITRTAQSAGGGPFTLDGGFRSLLANIVPAGWRPQNAIDVMSVLNNRDGGGKGELVCRIDTGGTMNFRVPGSRTIPGAELDTLTVVASWWI